MRQPPIVVYREFAPCAQLRRHVLALFSFTPADSVDPTPWRCVIREAQFGVSDT